jgi:hypothetical protein
MANVVTRATVTLMQPQLVELIHILTGLHPNQVFRTRPPDWPVGREWPPQILSLNVWPEQVQSGQWMEDDDSFILK